MRSLKQFSLFITFAFFLQSTFAMDAKPAFSVTEATQQALSPAQALHALVSGNQRFLDGKAYDYPHSEMMKFTTQQGQFPFAFVFNCIDSRSVTELVFDQGIGHLFVGRIAGNVVDADVLASMEYAVKFVGSKIIVVMGHTACGAIAAACSNLQTGNLRTLLAKIQPAVKQTEKKLKSKNCKDPEFINAIAKQNVLDQLTAAYNHSEIIRKLTDEKKIELIGAMQDLKTGKVTFFDRDGKEIK